MKKYILIILSIFFGLQISFADSEIKIAGIYQGENLYVMNPFSPNGVGFCIYEVLVNGQISTDEISSSAFEIDLSIYNFSLGDNVEIIIKHKEGCTPQILNPEVLMAKSTFTVESINVTKAGVLTWISTGEVGSLPYYVEQFKWNKWVKITTVNGIGSPGIHNYSANVHFTSGINKFRVKQIDHSKKPRYSEIVTYKNIAPAVTFKPGNGNKTSKEIQFSQSTEYEIYDYYGQLKKKGYGSSVDVSSYDNGTYFINYDNKTESFEKK